MKRFCLALAVLPIFLAGCAESYTVYVNGFSEAEKPIWDMAAIYVAVDANSENPIFEREIRRKTEKLLRMYGYVPSAKEQLADYRLGFKVGVDSREVTSYGYYRMPVWVGYGHYRDHYYGGYGTYVPYARSVYNHWLIMRVSDTGRLNPSKRGMVEWVGEAVTGRYSADLREAINYLLVGSFEYFGQDTKKRMTVTIDEKNPMIKEIMEYR
ncbi:MAG: DUF4136 domain-containing protein [Planctomycetota bacterium]|jgi:hypothetical protein